MFSENNSQRSYVYYCLLLIRFFWQDYLSKNLTKHKIQSAKCVAQKIQSDFLPFEISRMPVKTTIVVNICQPAKDFAFRVETELHQTMSNSCLLCLEVSGLKINNME